MSDQLMSAAVGGVVTLLSTLATAAIAWYKDRNEEAERLRLLDEATKQIAFWDAWLKFQLSLDPTEEHQADLVRTACGATSSVAQVVDKALQCAARTVQEQALARTAFESKRKHLPRWRRLFLVYQPARLAAWLPRLLFWCYFVYGLVGPVVFFGIEYVPYLGKRYVQFNYAGIVLELGGVVAGAETFAFLMRAVSRLLEEPRRDKF